MRVTKIELTHRVQEIMTTFPYRAVSRLYRFLTDKSVSGEVHFRFHRGKLIGWGDTIGKAKDFPKLEKILNRKKYL